VAAIQTKVLAFDFPSLVRIKCMKWISERGQLKRKLLFWWLRVKALTYMCRGDVSKFLYVWLSRIEKFKELAAQEV
jgi:hypothetical protein